MTQCLTVVILMSGTLAIMGIACKDQTGTSHESIAIGVHPMGMITHHDRDGHAWSKRGCADGERRAAFLDEKRASQLDGMTLNGQDVLLRMNNWREARMKVEENGALTTAQPNTEYPVLTDDGAFTVETREDGCIDIHAPFFVLATNAVVSNMEHCWANEDNWMGAFGLSILATVVTAALYQVVSHTNSRCLNRTESDAAKQTLLGRNDENTKPTGDEESQQQP